jgi:hypothetical protein
MLMAIERVHPQGDVLADNFLLLVAKNPFTRWIESPNDAYMIDGHDGVARGVNNPPVLCQYVL